MEIQREDSLYLIQRRILWAARRLTVVTVSHRQLEVDHLDYAPAVAIRITPTAPCTPLQLRREVLAGTPAQSLRGSQRDATINGSTVEEADGANLGVQRTL